MTGAGPGGQSDAGNDRPERVFRGKPFWEGYRPGDLEPNLPDNWVDFDVISLVTSLRPSRFKDPNYWRRYVPVVIVLSFLTPITCAVIILGSPSLSHSP